jgi:hypothetical protein
MEHTQVNFAAVLVAAIVTFMLGRLWYSRGWFGTSWMRLTGKSQEESSRGSRPVNYSLFAGRPAAL